MKELSVSLSSSNFSSSQCWGIAPLHHAPSFKIYNILVEYDNGTLHLGPKVAIINKINKLQDYTHIHIGLWTYKHVP